MYLKMDYFFFKFASRISIVYDPPTPKAFNQQSLNVMVR